MTNAFNVCGAVLIQCKVIVESDQNITFSNEMFIALITVLYNFINNTASHNCNLGNDCVFSGATLDFDDISCVLYC